MFEQLVYPQVAAFQPSKPIIYQQDGATHTGVWIFEGSFGCSKSLRNIPELQLQEYCNILKKLKEVFIVHSFRDFHLYDSSFNLFSNPMQINNGRH